MAHEFSVLMIGCGYGLVPFSCLALLILRVANVGVITMKPDSSAKCIPGQSLYRCMSVMHEPPLVIVQNLPLPTKLKHRARKN